MREEMVRGDHVQVMNPFPAGHVKNSVEESLHIDDIAKAFLRDLEVLTEGTSERATREKDCTGAAGAGKRGLFSEVRSHVADAEILTFPAEAALPLEPIHTAFPGAKPAILIILSILSHFIGSASKCSNSL